MPFIVFDEKSAIILYSLADFKIFLSIFSFQLFDYDVSRCGFPYDCPACLGFIELPGSTGLLFFINFGTFRPFCLQMYFNSQCIYLSLSFPFYSISNPKYTFVRWLNNVPKITEILNFFPALVFLSVLQSSFYCPDFTSSDLFSYGTSSVKLTYQNFHFRYCSFHLEF